MADAMYRPDPAVMLDALEHPETRFGGNAAEKRNQLLLTSLRSAYEEMEKLQGPDAKQWNWGKLQYNLSEHPFAAVVDDATRAKVNVGPMRRTVVLCAQCVRLPCKRFSSDGRSFGSVVVDVGIGTIRKPSTIPANPVIQIARTIGTWRRCGAAASTSVAVQPESSRERDREEDQAHPRACSAVKNELRSIGSRERSKPESPWFGRRGARLRPLEKQVALARITCERRRGLELRTGLAKAAELAEQVAAHAWQKVIGLQRRFGG